MEHKRRRFSFVTWISTIVNNAAFAIAGIMEDIPEEDAKAEFDTNISGTLCVCKAILPKMRQSELVLSCKSAAFWDLPSSQRSACSALTSLRSKVSDIRFLATNLLADLFRLAISEALPQETSRLDSDTDSQPRHDPDKFTRTRCNCRGRAFRAIITNPRHVVAATSQSEHDKHGKQPGDLEKAVKTIYDAVNGKDPNLARVLRLPMREDGWAATTAHMDEVRSDFDIWREVACSTNDAE
jgi:hypothetical protein